MPTCGSQVLLCDLPIRFDTYYGCTHQCKYCFATKKNYNMKNIKVFCTHQRLINFIKGKRKGRTRWCDWNIPLHWGGMSDPFQPVEKNFKESYKCLEVFVKTQYPFVVSTKGRLIAADEYLNLIKQCNCVVQISLVCPEFDIIEQGAPRFAERLEIVKKISPHKRVNIRIQPYMIEYHDSIMNSLDKFAKAGAYGVIVEGIKFEKAKKGLVRVGGDSVYPIGALKPKVLQIKEKAHKLGMKFYSGENRLRRMGDDLCCCGIDGLKGFKGNSFNINHIINGGEFKITPAMEKAPAISCASIYQQAGAWSRLKSMTFKDFIINEYKNKEEYFKEILTDKKK